MPAHSAKIQQLDIQDFDFPTFYKNVNKLSGAEYVLLSPDPKAVFKKIRKGMELIKAAGGLVRNGNDDYLFIFRHKKWDLPKGKTEKGEKMKHAAVREVEEECGVTIASNDGKICKTYHVYSLHGKPVLKKTNWYAMTVKGEPELTPQLEEDITKAVWLDRLELKPVLKNTYPSIKQVLDEAGLLV
ncbi:MULTISPECIES: NUDIX hydrolase [Pedobacter]|uniref:NUDIX hydrolase n=1 Tax=Pedobacter TaxID=84567 RepID=UPI00210C3E47|nr:MULTISPECIES: NUDIX domain-containing protein [unclassified Pedobacter]